MTYSLLKVSSLRIAVIETGINKRGQDTKIGKVVKAACSYPFEDDTVIKDRCQHLMRSWKTLFIDPQPSTLQDKGSHDDNSHMQEV